MSVEPMTQEAVGTVLQRMLRVVLVTQRYGFGEAAQTQAREGLAQIPAPVDSRGIDLEQWKLLQQLLSIRDGGNSPRHLARQVAFVRMLTQEGRPEEAEAAVAVALGSQFIGRRDGQPGLRLVSFVSEEDLLSELLLAALQSLGGGRTCA